MPSEYVTVTITVASFLGLITRLTSLVRISLTLSEAYALVGADLVIIIELSTACLSLDDNVAPF